MRSFCTLCALIFCSFSLYGQTAPPLSNEDALESILEQTAQDSEESPAFDALEFYAEHPIHLRTAKPSDIEKLGIFSADIAQKICKLAQSSDISSFEILQERLNLSETAMQILRACTFFDKVISEKKRGKLPPIFSYRIRHRQRLNTISAFEKHSFEGSSLELYQRLRYVSGNIDAGITLEKDAGERSIADFTSAFAKINWDKTDIILGDFSVQSGCGSVLSGGFGGRKSSDVLSLSHQYAGFLSPYRSATELRFFRGLALSSELPVGESSLSLKTWVSSFPRAGTSDSAANAVTSLTADGYFRTSSEISRQNAVKEQSAGFSAMWQSADFSVGTSALGLLYDKEILSESSSAFRGKSGVISSVFASGTLKQTTLSGEISRDANANIGIKAEMHSLAPQWKGVLAFRSFGANFRSPFGANSGESSQPVNEIGLYTGFLWKADTRWSLSVYADIFRTPAPTFSVPVPVRGLDFFAEIRWKESSATTYFLRIRNERKTDAFSTNDEFNRPQTLGYQRTKTSVRTEIQQVISELLSIRLRWEASFLSYEGWKKEEMGNVIAGEIHWIPVAEASFAIRAAYFSTDSYDSAIWQFEPNIPGSLSSPALYGKGMRIAALAGYSPLENIKLWLRAGITAKNGVSSLGSGYFEIEGNTERQVLFQADIGF